MIHLVGILDYSGIGWTLYSDDTLTIPKYNLLWGLISALEAVSAEILGVRDFKEIKIGNKRLIVFDESQETSKDPYLIAIASVWDSVTYVMQKLREIQRIINEKVGKITLHRPNLPLDVLQSIEAVTEFTQSLPEGSLMRLQPLIVPLLQNKERYQINAIFIGDIDEGIVHSFYTENCSEEWLNFTKRIFLDLQAEFQGSQSSIWLESDVDPSGKKEAWIIRKLGGQTDFNLMIRVIYLPGEKMKVTKILEDLIKLIEQEISTYFTPRPWEERKE